MKSQMFIVIVIRDMYSLIKKKLNGKKVFVCMTQIGLYFLIKKTPELDNSHRYDTDTIIMPRPMNNC